MNEYDPYFWYSQQIIYFECLWLIDFASKFAILLNACRYLIANLELFQYYKILRNCLEFSIVFAKTIHIG